MPIKFAIIAVSGVGSGAVAAVSQLISSISVPEPGMMLLFGIGTAALGLRIGRRQRK